MRAQLVSAGESDLDIDSSLSVVTPMKKSGAPIDWTALTPALAVPAGHGIALHAPHPNAAKLFIEFLLSKEGQKTNLSFERNVIRSDLLEEQGALKEAKLVPVDPTLGENMDYYGKQAREIFGQVGGRGEGQRKRYFTAEARVPGKNPFMLREPQHERIAVTGNFKYLAVRRFDKLSAGSEPGRRVDGAFFSRPHS